MPEPQAEKLAKILDTMNIPDRRREDFDLRWIQRNLGFRNADHPQFEEAMRLATQLLRREKKNAE